MTIQRPDQPSVLQDPDVLQHATTHLDRIAEKLEDSTANFEVCLSRMRVEAAAAGAELLRMAESDIIPTDPTTPWRYYALQARRFDARHCVAEFPHIPAHVVARCYYVWNQLSGEAAKMLRDQIRQLVDREDQDRRSILNGRLKAIDDSLAKASKRRRARIALEGTPDPWHNSWSWMHNLVVSLIRSGEFQAVEQSHPTWTYLEQYASQPFFSSFGHSKISSGRSSPPLTFDSLVESMAFLHEQSPLADAQGYRDRHILIEHCLDSQAHSSALRLTPWTVEVASFDPTVAQGEQVRWSCDHGLTRTTAALLAAQLAKVCRELASTLELPRQSGSSESSTDGEWRAPGWFAGIRNAGLTAPTLKKARHREQIKARPAGRGRYELLVSSVVAQYPNAADAIRRQLEQEAE